MNSYTFMTTEDGSVGLYNNIVQDIYHSKYGALKESIEKFILPSGILDFVNHNKEVKILDICFGIGYNSKNALYFSKKSNNNIKIIIDALENDLGLTLLSPFVKDSIDCFELKIFLLSELLKKSSSNINLIEELVCNDSEFFSPDIIDFFKKNKKNIYKTSSEGEISTLLHNIYYKYVSNSMKNSSENLLFSNCSFECYCNDARKSLLSLDEQYDFVFLDAFTPLKDPTLWTYDFLSLVKSKMNKNSVLLTYSNSTPVRSVFLELGFNVGKILINEKEFGTIASFDREKIINPLTEFDIGLTKTTGGIFYRDIDLNLSKDEIIFNRQTEMKNSARMSLSRYKKESQLK